MLSELPFKLWWIYFLGYLFHVINSGPLSFSFMENVFILPIHATNFPQTKNSFHACFQCNFKIYFIFSPKKTLNLSWRYLLWMMIMFMLMINWINLCTYIILTNKTRAKWKHKNYPSILINKLFAIIIYDWYDELKE